LLNATAGGGQSALLPEEWLTVIQYVKKVRKVAAKKLINAINSATSLVILTIY
jgi:hypothetical protein